MHATNTTQAQQVHFLTCFDQNDVAWSDDWVTTGQMPPPNTSALQCAAQSGIDKDAVQKCANGTQGEALMQDALKYFAKTFPMYTTGARFDVPHVYINNVEFNIANLPVDIWSVIMVLCASGSGGVACLTEAASTESKTVVTV